MTTKAHKLLTGTDLHESKGVSSAAVNTSYIADGAGSGSWTKIGPSQTDGTVQGGDVFLGVQTASASATIAFKNGSSNGSTIIVMDNTYAEYMVKMNALVFSNDAIDLYFRVGTGAGPTYIAAGTPYVTQFSGSRTNIGGSGFDAQTGALNQINLSALIIGAGSGIGNGAGKSYSGTLYFNSPASTLFPMFTFQSRYISSAGDGAYLAGTGWYTPAVAVTGIQFLPSAGTITSGTFTVYGWRKI